jgi:hypothetical protein
MVAEHGARTKAAFRERWRCGEGSGEDELLAALGPDQAETGELFGAGHAFEHGKEDTLLAYEMAAGRLEGSPYQEHRFVGAVSLAGFNQPAVDFLVFGVKPVAIDTVLRMMIEEEEGEVFLDGGMAVQRGGDLAGGVAEFSEVAASRQPAFDVLEPGAKIAMFSH